MPFDLQSIPFIGIALLVFGIGFLNCFFGFRVIRSAFALWGIVAGIYVGMILIPSADSEITTLLAAAVFGGVVGGVIFVALYLLGAIAIGAALGFTFSLIAMGFMGMETNLFISVIFAIVFAILSLFLNRLFIIGATAFSGASAMALAGAAIFYDQASLLNVNAREEMLDGARALPPIIWIAWILLGFIGTLVQYRMTNDD